MFELIQSMLNSDEKIDLGQFLAWLRSAENRNYLLRNDILSAFANYCRDREKTDAFCNYSLFSKLIHYTQEIILENESSYLVVRPKIPIQEVYRINGDLSLDAIAVEELLDLRDRLVDRSHI